MLLRQRCARGRLCLPHTNTGLRPNVPLGRASLSLQDPSASTRRLLVTQTNLAPWRRKTSPAFSSPVSHRPLATAIDDATLPDDTPFVDHARSRYAQSPSSVPLYHLRTFDPTAPLQVKIQEDTIPRSRATQKGIPGGIDEMLALFSAYLELGQLERAALVLGRLNSKGLPNPDAITLNNEYLRAGIKCALEQPESQWPESLHQWFEMQILKGGIPHTHETIACMLKTSLLSTQGPELDKLVTRYMKMLPDTDLWPVWDAGVLNHQDFGIITSIYQPASDFDMDELDPLMEEDEVETVASEKATDQAVPDVRPVPQKGLGLSTLRSVLSFFEEIHTQDVGTLPMAERREIQSRLEKDCVEAAIKRWREENEALTKIGRTTVASQGALNRQLYDWQCALESKIKEEFKLFDAAERREKKTSADQERCLYAPFMRQSTPTRLAAVTIMGVLNTLASHGADKGVPLSTLLTSLAKLIEEDIRFQMRQKRDAEFNANVRKQRKQRAEKYKSSLANNTSADQDVTADKDVPEASEETVAPQQASNIVEAPAYDNTSWPILIKAKVGARLLAALFEAAKVKVLREDPDTRMVVSHLQPALARTTVHRKGKRIGIVTPNRVLVELLKQEPRGDYLARHLPMLVEPQPWSRFDHGGFLEFPSHLVRIKNGERDQKVYAEAAIERGDLDQVIKGLDVLGRTAWQINRPVFDVMLEAWNGGEKIANIPALNPDIPLPEEPVTSDDPLARREWLRRLKLVQNEKSGLHSERCFMNFQLDIAKAFRAQTFYFPHNMDFRGRAYPIPAYLNHMGADHVRGILRFAKGKELGVAGLRWLKVHLANVFGYDKASLEEREAFAMEHVQDIADSVANPLTGQKWWLKAEDPWQCLATCFELQAALDCPDPTKYVSHLPIHQDGTCNGLQHYAALGGDTWGAQQVNLLPGDRPADVYSAVASLVKVSIAEDLESGSFLAKAVNGKITRKVVKQTVMTNVYGVTFIGAKAQVLKQIDAAYPNIEAETGVPSPVLASYIATKIFKALSTMFRGAHDIQYWLGECAGRVCRALVPEQLERIANEAEAAQAAQATAVPAEVTRKPRAPRGSAKTDKEKETKTKKRAKSAKKDSGTATEDILNQFRSTIVWTTPLRMPIVQPYRKSSTRVITTCLQDLTLQTPERSDPVNRRKQLQAFPPNFIHSLDASHMLLSALECDELGLSFAAVHDSFWTHAADIDVMNRVLRDAFVRIHEEDVIGRLRSEFEARYSGSLYLAKIAQGTEAAKLIAGLRSKDRRTMHDELLQEIERQKLLASSIPKDVRKGRKMVTPASIHESSASAECLSSAEEMDEVALGSITSASPQDDEIEEGCRTTMLSTEPDETERMQGFMNITHFEATMKNTKNTTATVDPKPTKSRQEYISIWLPLSFPPIPAKGDFDVNKLRSSKYFFS